MNERELHKRRDVSITSVSSVTSASNSGGGGGISSVTSVRNSGGGGGGSSSSSVRSGGGSHREWWYHMIWATLSRLGLPLLLLWHMWMDVNWSFLHTDTLTSSSSSSGNQLSCCCVVPREGLALGLSPARGETDGRQGALRHLGLANHN